MTIKWQFIAGACCPQCKVEDRIRLCRDGEWEWMECVVCNYKSSNPIAPEHTDPPTADVGSEVGVVRFLPGG